MVRAPSGGLCARGDSSILGRVANLIWFLVCWFTLVGLVCAVLGGFYFYGHVDESIRGQVEQHLGRLYPEYRVRVAGAKLIEREGFEIRGISFGAKRATDDPLLFIDEILVRCRPTLDDLLNKNPRIHEIIVRHAALNAQQDPLGAWNFAGLLKPPQADAMVPRISVENSTIQISGREDSRLDLRNLNAHVTSGDADLKKLQVDMAFTGNHLQHFVAHCELDRIRSQWTVSGTMQNVAITPNLQNALPLELAAFLTPLTELEAQNKY